MRIQVSEELCQGHGRCYSLAPEVFESDEDGYCAQRGPAFTVAAELEEAGRIGITNCPEGAIRMVATD